MSTMCQALLQWVTDTQSLSLWGFYFGGGGEQKDTISKQMISEERI
jgi:hypothetical protein